MEATDVAKGDSVHKVCSNDENESIAQPDFQLIRRILQNGCVCENHENLSSDILNFKESLIKCGFGNIYIKEKFDNLILFFQFAMIPNFLLFSSSISILNELIISKKFNPILMFDDNIRYSDFFR